MKLLLQNPDLCEKMFEPLVGKTLRMVVSGTPKSGFLLAVGRTEDGKPGFYFDFGSGHQGIVAYDNIWEMTVC